MAITPVIQVSNDWYSLHDVAGDGNCFYHSLCQASYFKTVGFTHATLRKDLWSKVQNAIETLDKNDVLVLLMNRIRLCFHDRIFDHEIIRQCAQLGTWNGSCETYLINLFYPVELNEVRAETTIATHTNQFGISVQPEYMSSRMKHTNYYNDWVNKVVREKIYILVHGIGMPFHVSYPCNHYLFLQQVNIDANNESLYRKYDKPMVHFNPHDVQSQKNECVGAKDQPIVLLDELNRGMDNDSAIHIYDEKKKLVETEQEGK